MYISRIRPHDADKKRREFARNRALFLDSKRGAFVDWCLRTGIPQAKMEEELANMDDLIQVWLDVADQAKVD